MKFKDFFKFANLSLWKQSKALTVLSVVSCLMFTPGIVLLQDCRVSRGRLVQAGAGWHALLEAIQCNLSEDILQI